MVFDKHNTVWVHHFSKPRNLAKVPYFLRNPQSSLGSSRPRSQIPSPLQNGNNVHVIMDHLPRETPDFRVLGSDMLTAEQMRLPSTKQAGMNLTVGDMKLLEVTGPRKPEAGACFLVQQETAKEDSKKVPPRNWTVWRRTGWDTDKYANMKLRSKFSKEDRAIGTGQQINKTRRAPKKGLPEWQKKKKSQKELDRIVRATRINLSLKSMWLPWNGKLASAVTKDFQN